VDWAKYNQNYDLIRDSISATISGFTDYNKKVKNEKGFYLPNAAREGKFRKDTGKAHFSISHYQRLQISENEFMMTTVRSHDQFNTTIYGLNDRYRGITNERRVVLMNPADMKQFGLVSNDIVDLYNHTNGVERLAPKFVVVAYDIPKKTIATYFPEANVLVPISETAEQSNTPVSKFVVVTIEKHSTLT